jgi:hypothetical protein
VRLIACAGRINIDNLITHVPPFEQINDGLELVPFAMRRTRPS